MKIFQTTIVTILAMLMLSCATAQNSVDMDAFFERREICDHLRGEFPNPSNPKQAREFFESVKEHCTGTDAQLAALKVQYADNPAIMERLNAYEPRIERKK
jgi:hypothetical protein